MKLTQTLATAATGLLLVSTLGLPAAQASVLQHVFVITLENTDASQIYGNTTDAPYINSTLLPNYAHATNWNDELPSLASEPHYIWMEAGTNAFSDHTFTTDNDPSRKNSTSSTAHLVTQIKNSLNGVTWMTYQEGQNASTGACPVVSSGFYAAKHNPFVFFKDVSGNTPSTTNAYCAAHSKPYTSLAADLAANNIASYVFITPNLCNDMHGATGCPNGNRIRSGDDWLAAELPNLINWANLHSSVILLTWDEGSGTTKMPFLAIGPGVKANYTGAVSYDHKSIIKSVEEIFGLPLLSTVSGATDLADLFQPGFFP
jgi:hypothetical protein